MKLCQRCQSISGQPLRAMNSYATFAHDFHSLRKAVEIGCSVCSELWDTLSPDQKQVASRPDFQGITCKIALDVFSREEGRRRPILATMNFYAESDLWDCEDAEGFGTWHRSGAGQFAILNPDGMFNPLATATVTTA